MIVHMDNIPQGQVAGWKSLTQI